MESVPLIEISSEDDHLIPSSSQEFGFHTSTMEPGKIEKVKTNLEEAPHLSDSPEQNQKASDRFNARKSLAWDSAFLTGEGILDHEELATMNGKHSKVVITLPGIQELRNSSESTSTLESDNWALERLEVNLFDNVRNSIQWSLGSSNHAKNMVHYEEIKEQEKPDAPPNARTLKTIHDSPEIKLKPPTSMRRNDVTRQCLERTSNGGGLVSMNKASHGNAESKPLIRPPKISSKTILLPASVPGKKASIEIKGAAAKQQSIVASNKANGLPFIALTKPTSGSQTDSGRVSSVATFEKRSANRIISYSSSRNGKTPLNSSMNGSTVGHHHRSMARPPLILSKISPASSVGTVVSETSSSTSVSTKLGKSFEGRAESYINGDCGSRLAGPSGLRAPMPAIGYFDKEKTLVHGSNKAPEASLQNNLKKNDGAANKVRPGESRIPSALSKQASKYAKVVRIEHQQRLCLKVNKISAETVEQKWCNINFKDEGAPVHGVGKVRPCGSGEKEEPNLLHPRDFAMENETGTGTVEEQRTKNSYIAYKQQESLKNGQNPGDRETEKENLCPELKAEDLSKLQKMEAVIGEEDAPSFTF